MRIAITNLFGNAGKTSLAAHLLSPRLADAPIFSVDEANTTVTKFGLAATNFKGDDFGEIYRAIMLLDKAVIDVGGSTNLYYFLNGMAAVEDAHDEIDAFLIPTVPNHDKCVDETIKTYKLLISSGVPKEKIHFVFNMVKASAAAEFSPLIEALNTLGAQYKLESTLFESKLFNLLSIYEMTIENLLNDKRDFKALAIKETNPDKRDAYTNLRYAQKMAPKVKENLDNLFISLFPAKEESGKKVKETANQ
ncbi:StbB family protein [Chromobacterium violaceum]|uniref:StbB family protein n=1 Tax=Chromobacterium violaceum TaxID=536 RepID=UPI0035A673AD